MGGGAGQEGRCRSEVESLFKSSEHGMKVLYDSDVYAVTFGGEHGEGDSCDEEGAVPLQEQ